MSFDAGSAVGKLLLDTQGWDGAIDNAVAKMTGLQNITGAINKVRDAFAPVINQAMAWVKEFAGADAATSRLESVLKATGGTAGVTADEINKLASAMQNTTTFEDDAVKNAAALLAVYDKVNKDIFPQTIKLAADMATVFGGDLSSNAQMLGKALQNPAENLSVLNRQTRAFDQATQDVIKTMVEMGNITEAQNLILETMAGKVGGAAEAMGTTAAGAIAQLTNLFGDLEETLGQVVYQGFKPVIDIIKGILQWFSSMEEGAGKAIAAFVAIGVALTVAFGPAGAVAAAVIGLVNLGKAIDDATGPGKVLKEQQEAEKKALESIVKSRKEATKAFEKDIETKLASNKISRQEIEDLYESSIAMLKKFKIMGVSAGAEKTLMTDLAALRARWKIQDDENTKAAIDNLKAKQDAEKEHADFVMGIYSKQASAQKQLDKAKWDAIEAHSTKATANIGAMQEAATAKADEEINKQIQEFTEAYNKISSVVQSSLSGIFNFQQQLLKNEEMALNNEYDARKKSIEANVTDEEERTKQLAALEDEKARKIADIKRRQAEAEKNSAIFSAVISGIQAVMTVFSQFGWPWGLIPAAIMAGITAANVAAIAAQPIPAFAAGGTSTGGMALVGEKGPELVNFGSTARIFPNDESRKMMGGVTVQNTFTGPINSEVDIDLAMKRAGQKLAQAARTI